MYIIVAEAIRFFLLCNSAHPHPFPYLGLVSCTFDFVQHWGCVRRTLANFIQQAINQSYCFLYWFVVCPLSFGGGWLGIHLFR